MGRRCGQHYLARQDLRVSDLEGKSNVDMLLYNAYEKQERYNMPDTLKGQHIFYLTAPYCVHSDMGRLFCSITADTMGWHDTVCGCRCRPGGAAMWAQNYQKPAMLAIVTHSAFPIRAKWGLGKRDLVPI